MRLDYDLLAMVLATAGFGMFLWPVIQRLRGLDTAKAQADRVKLRSRGWWLGFVLICLALMAQRLATQQAGG